jgi:hypothetical protein
MGYLRMICCLATGNQQSLLPPHSSPLSYAASCLLRVKRGNSQKHGTLIFVAYKERVVCLNCPAQLLAVP